MLRQARAGSPWWLVEQALAFQAFMADHTNGGEDTSSNHHWILGKEVFPCSPREWLANKATPPHLEAEPQAREKTMWWSDFLRGKGARLVVVAAKKREKILGSKLENQIPNLRGGNLQLYPEEEQHFVGHNERGKYNSAYSIGPLLPDVSILPAISDAILWKAGAADCEMWDGHCHSF
ncbi:hypothetical protein TIFTF001_035074 [Ficus carica]|uniref:Uncharacterized protein n=1 Tax=Ficus carica TaxID=3494 RepID=A0AA88J9S4_FICCA|nr:hypothetical protein TIFTF001_042565 [Ficus carica]GMN66007.1 hypothetical protein TIFTF001_035074 [Ficus carica]